MSARALAWAWRQQPRTAAQKLVLAALADRADDDGECFPSVSWIAAKCAPMGEDHVRGAIRELASSGLVEKVERRRRADGTLGTWIYRLPVDDALAGPESQWSPPGPEYRTDSRQEEDLSVEPNGSTALVLIDELPDGRQVVGGHPAKPESAQTLLAEIVDDARALDIPLPERVKLQFARNIKLLLDEGQPVEAVRAGVTRMMERRIVQPAMLANFVTEAALASRPPPPRGRKYGYGVRNDELEDAAQRLEREGR